MMNERSTRPLLFVALVAAVVLQWPHGEWFVDDAGISFVYAKHLAQGHGLVAVPGGERVEGFSNPLWVALLAAGEWLGIPAERGALGLAWVLAALTAWMVWRIGQRSRGEGGWRVAPIAVTALLVQATFTPWNASGLENPLVNAWVAACIWSLALEWQDPRRFPWSALAFLGLALTRPEGIAYAAIGLACTAFVQVRHGRGLRPVLLWTAMLAVPVAGFEAARLAYFAWPLPNTSYVKLGDEALGPWNWRSSGWQALRHAGSFGTQRGGEPGLGLIYLLPVQIMGALGVGGRRFVPWLVLGLAAAIVPASLVLSSLRHLAPGSAPALAEPMIAVASIAPVVGLAAVAGIVGWLAVRRDDPVPALCWCFCAAGVAFAALAGRDWMAGFRWLSLISVPTALLFALGVVAAWDAAQRATHPVAPFVRAWAIASALLFVAVHVHHQAWWTYHRPISIANVARRAEHWSGIARWLQLERPTLLEVDVGAHLLDGRFDIIDLVGLTDVPIARHRHHPRFLVESLLDERSPDLVHVHPNSARATGLARIRAFRESYVEVKGYPRRASPEPGDTRTHDGHWVRRDLLFEARRDSRLEGSARTSSAPAMAVLGRSIEALRTGSPRVGAGGALDVEIDWGRELERDAAARLAPIELSLAVGDHDVASWQVEPGFRRLVIEAWPDDEVHVDRHRVELPADVAPGEYVVRLRAVGGVVLEGPTVSVLDREAFERVRAGELEMISLEARDGRCAIAETLAARWRRSTGPDDKAPGPPLVADPASLAVAECWLQRAHDVSSDLERVAPLLRARSLADVGGDEAHALAQALSERGHSTLAEARRAKRAQADPVGTDIRLWQRAYDELAAAVALDPTRSWDRRRAEEARSERIRLADAHGA